MSTFVWNDPHVNKTDQRYSALSITYSHVSDGKIKPVAANWCLIVRTYPAEPGYSHCAEPGRSDLHFSMAGRVKQTLTPPSDKTESGIRLYSASALW